MNVTRKVAEPAPPPPATVHIEMTEREAAILGKYVMDGIVWMDQAEEVEDFFHDLFTKIEAEGLNGKSVYSVAGDVSLRFEARR